MPLAVFTLRAIGAILGPLLVVTAFMAFTPCLLGGHQAIIVIVSLGVGFVASYPRQWTTTAFLLRCVYILAMVYALGAWMFVAAGRYFPAAYLSLGIGRAGPGPFPTCVGW